MAAHLQFLPLLSPHLRPAASHPSFLLTQDTFIYVQKAWPAKKKPATYAQPCSNR